MKMRALWLVGVLALAPALLQGQEVKRDSTAPLQVKKAPTMRIVRLTDRDVDRALPQLQAELSGTVPMDNAVNAMTRTEYVAVKNALMVARLDYLQAGRLQGPADDKLLEARRMNANYYRLNVGRFEALLQRATPDVSCTLCGPSR